MSRKMLRNVEKRGVHTAGNGPSPSPCVTKPEIGTADRLGSREGSSRAGRRGLLTPWVDGRVRSLSHSGAVSFKWSSGSHQCPKNDRCHSGAFLSPPAPSFGFTDDWPLSSRPTPHAPPSAGTSGLKVVRRPSPAGYSDTNRGITKRPNGTRSRRTADLDEWPLYFIMSPNRAIPAEKSNRSSPLATAPP